MFDGPLRDALQGLVRELKSLRETITTTPTPLSTPRTYSVRVPIGERFVWPTTKDAITGAVFFAQEVSLDLSDGDYLVEIIHNDAPVITVSALAFRFRPLVLDAALTAIAPMSIKIELDEAVGNERVRAIRSAPGPRSVALVIQGVELKASSFLPGCPPPGPFYGPLTPVHGGGSRLRGRR